MSLIAIFLKSDSIEMGIISKKTNANYSITFVHFEQRICSFIGRPPYQKFSLPTACSIYLLSQVSRHSLQLVGSGVWKGIAELFLVEVSALLLPSTPKCRKIPMSITHFF